MTNCRLPKPDWQLLSRHIDVADGHASTTNTIFKLFGVPIFDLPYLRHPVDETGRESGLLIPVISIGSSIRGFTFGEQAYLVLNRSMDMVARHRVLQQARMGAQRRLSLQGAGPRPPDRALECPVRSRFRPGAGRSGPQAGQTVHVNQGGVDIWSPGPQGLSPRHAHRRQRRVPLQLCLPPGVQRQLLAGRQLRSEERCLLHPNRTTASCRRCTLGACRRSPGPTEGDEARILHLPSVRFDVLDQPLGGFAALLGHGIVDRHLGRSEPRFPRPQHRPRSIFYPHLSMPIRGRRMEHRSRSARCGDVLLRQPDSRSDGRAMAAFPPSATIRCTASTARHRSISGRRPSSGISTSAAGTGRCAT